MRILFLRFALLITVTVISCKDNVKSDPLTQSTTTESVEKRDIIIELNPIYLSPKAKPIIANWKEYIDVQNKVYELKNTNTIKLNKQVDELDKLILKLLNSTFPQKLETHLFERKIYLLDESVTELRSLLNKENISFDDIERLVLKILNNYDASKNQINAIYGG